MIKRYYTRRSLTVKDQDISLYFKDRESPVFIPLFDILQLCDKTKYDITDIKELAGKKKCETIETVADYTVKVYSVTDCIDILKKVRNDAQDIVNVISNFVDQQKELLSETAKDQNVTTKNSDKYFDMISVNGHSIRFVQVDNVRWFNIQDTVKFFVPLKSYLVEDQICLLNIADIVNLKFPNEEIRKCISESGFITLIQTLLTDKADIIIKELQKAARELDIKVSETLQGIKDLSIDGEATSVLRYAFITVNGIKCAMYRHSKNHVIPFFSVKSTASLLQVNPTGYLQKACSKKIKFVTADDIFLTIQGLRNVFYGTTKIEKVCSDIEKAIKQNDTLEKIIEVTDYKERVILLNKQKKTDTVTQDIKTASPSLTMTNGQHITFYGNVQINEVPVLVCFTKKDIHNKEEDPEPWFWSTSIGYAFNIRETTRIAGKYVDKDNKSKTTIHVLQKFNIRMLTIEGIKQTVLHSSEAKEADNIVITIKKALNDFIDENQDQEGVRKQKYEIRSDSVVEEKENKITEEKQEHIENVPAITGTINYRQGKVDLRIITVPSKGIMIYYSLPQLLDCLNTDQDIKDKILRNNKEFVSIFELEDVLSDISDAAVIVQELLALSKEQIQEAMVNLGTDKEQQKDQQEEETTVTDKSVRTFIVRAIILAEKYRAVLATIKRQGKEVRGLPGPADYKLLEDLWHYIDAVSTDQVMGFGFQRQLIMVSERLKRLETLA